MVGTQDIFFRAAAADVAATDAGQAEDRSRRPVWVRELTADLHATWSRYVALAPDATLFHELAWKQAVERGYGHRPHYLLAGRGGRVTGVLPLFEVSGPFTGRALISVPYGIYGGILAGDAETAWALGRAAEGLRDHLGARYVELRQREAVAVPYQANDRYVTFRKELPDRPEDVLGWLPRKARAAARQARERHGLTAAFGANEFDCFYRLYVRSLGRLGSPPYSRRFLWAVLEAYGERAEVLLVRHGHRPVAGVLALRFKDELFAYVSGADERRAALQTNNFLYLSLMERAVEMGLRTFDFGRSRKDNPGPYAFKQNQGFEARPLPYLMSARAGCRLPDVTPSNPAFSWPRKVWMRLPRPAVGVLGSLLTRWIP